jgi:putative endonuclease
MLRGQGLRPVIRNYTCRLGEIDLIMLDNSVLVFVEVRYRQSDRYGSGADSVTLAKQRRIVRAAKQFLRLNPRHDSRPARFDVVSVGRGTGGIELNWIRSAFDAD